MQGLRSDLEKQGDNEKNFKLGQSRFVAARWRSVVIFKPVSRHQNHKEQVNLIRHEQISTLLLIRSVRESTTVASATMIVLGDWTSYAGYSTSFSFLANLKSSFQVLIMISIRFRFPEREPKGNSFRKALTENEYLYFQLNIKSNNRLLSSQSSAAIQSQDNPASSILSDSAQLSLWREDWYPSVTNSL